MCISASKKIPSKPNPTSAPGIPYVIHHTGGTGLSLRQKFGLSHGGGCFFSDRESSHWTMGQPVKKHENLQIAETFQIQPCYHVPLNLPWQKEYLTPNVNKKRIQKILWMMNHDLMAYLAKYSLLSCEGNMGGPVISVISDGWGPPRCVLQRTLVSQSQSVRRNANTWVFRYPKMDQWK